MNNAIPMIAAGAMKTDFHFLLMFNSSCFRKFVVNILQPLAEMQHRITLAREQGVDANSGFSGEFLEAAAFHFVRDEYFALFCGQVAECRLQFLEQHTTCVESVGAGVR